MNRLPKVSIIVPAFRVGPYIEQCLKSLLAQTYSNIEIIVILRSDNEDDTCEKVKGFCKFEKIKISYQIKKGLSAARNLGIELSSGDYLTFVDGDDFVSPLYVATLVKNFSNDIDIVCSNPNFNVLSKKDESNRIKYFKKPIKEGVYFTTSKILFQIPVVAWGKLYKTNIIKTNNIFFPEKLNFEDNYFFWIYMSFAKKIYFSGAPLYTYTIRDDSLFGAVSNGISSDGKDNIYILKNIVNSLICYSKFGFINAKLIGRYYFNALDFSSKIYYSEIDSVLGSVLPKLSFNTKIKFIFYFLKKYRKKINFINFFSKFIFDMNLEKIGYSLSSFIR